MKGVGVPDAVLQAHHQRAGVEDAREVLAGLGGLAALHAAKDHIAGRGALHVGLIVDRRAGHPAGRASQVGQAKPSRRDLGSEGTPSNEDGRDATGGQRPTDERADGPRAYDGYLQSDAAGCHGRWVDTSPFISPAKSNSTAPGNS